MNSKSEKFHTLLRYITILLTPVLFQYCERPVDDGDIDDGIPPSPPSGIEIYFASDGKIAFDWRSNPEADISHYIIKRSVGDSSHFVWLWLTYNNYFIDGDLSYDSLYCYYINAVDKSGLVSPPSAVVSAKPVNRYKPHTPQDFTVTCSNHDKPSAHLQWDFSQEGDIWGYLIYRGDTPDFQPDSANSIFLYHTNGYSDTTSLEVGKRYYYKLYAVDYGGLRSSEPATGNDLPLPKPIPVYPADSQEVNTIPVLKFLGVGFSCYYKVIIFTDPQFSDLLTLDVGSFSGSDTIRFIPQNFTFDYNRRYYWRVFTYTASLNSSNSSSRNYSFILRR